MIHSRDITNPSTSPVYAAQTLADIEARIDRAIVRHVNAGYAWPLTIATTRSGWSASDIETVLARYRTAGWKAQSGGHGAMAVLSPSEQAPLTADALIDGGKP